MDKSELHLSVFLLQWLECVSGLCGVRVSFVQILGYRIAENGSPQIDLIGSIRQWLPTAGGSLYVHYPSMFMNTRPFLECRLAHNENNDKVQ
jgi:hypothetical protein